MKSSRAQGLRCPSSLPMPGDSGQAASLCPQPLQCGLPPASVRTHDGLHGEGPREKGPQKSKCGGPLMIRQEEHQETPPAPYLAYSCNIIVIS